VAPQVNVGVPDCGPCDLVSKKMRAAGTELRSKAPGVTLAQLTITTQASPSPYPNPNQHPNPNPNTITTQDSPVIGKIVQGALTLPKV
jgi:hypothetical protein